ncbi:MAG: hypothetical protein ACREGA_04155 [Candidatus Saccharimonadales bacterium]
MMPNSASGSSVLGGGGIGSAGLMSFSPNARVSVLGQNAPATAPAPTPQTVNTGSTGTSTATPAGLASFPASYRPTAR